MYNESQKWFSQTLMYYEDKFYQTDGKLRVGISTNTGDDINFNPPGFNISISHNFQKACNLNIQQAMDLFDAVKTVLKEASFQDVEILRRIKHNLELSLLFKLDQNENAVVQMVLRSNSSDFTKIIVPVNVFFTMANRLKSFINNYDQLCYQLLMKSIDGEDRQIIRQIPGLIRGISSQIITSSLPDSGAVVSEPDDPAPAEQTIAELDSFLKTTEVEIPELESKKIKTEETMFEVKSILVDKVIDKKLINLENILTTIDSSKIPVDDFHQELSTHVDKVMSFLPGLDEEENKSIAYVSKLICSLITESHIKQNSPIPPSTPILKYKVKKIEDENLELSYDLLTMFSYMRAVRNKLNDKTSDFIINKSRFYLQMRCYLDVFCFSFLEKADKDQLLSIVMNRFKYYDSIGVFDEYKEILTKYSCSQISTGEIEMFVNEVSEKVIGKTEYIMDQQDNLCKNNSFRLPSSNNFTLEQIINEIVPLELNEKMGVNIQDPEAVKYASAEIINWFADVTEPKVTKKTKEKTSNIVRFVNHYRNEIPEQYREDFLQWLPAVVDMNFTFDDCEFPLAEFGSNIIKGLYLWKPEDDEKLTKSYKYFWSKFEDCILEKTHILAIDEKEETKTEEWSDAFDNISFE
jgi:hypothetical protein